MLSMVKLTSSPFLIGNTVYVCVCGVCVWCVYVVCVCVEHTKSTFSRFHMYCKVLE